MTTSLYNAWTQEGTTINGMTTNTTSLSNCLDFFFISAASRGKDISVPFIKAYHENSEVAVRTLLWLRDVRGGAGERQQFRNLALELLNQSEEDAKKVLRLIPEVGRWDDVLEFMDTALEAEVITMIKTALDSGNGLCAKWMPRKGEVAVKLRNHFGWSPKFYRKTLVNLTKVVETQMCAKEWDKIEYGHVPSVAAARYQHAFDTHDHERYMDYRNKVQNGDAKINASAIYPHDVIVSARKGGKLADEQWKALPDYMVNSNERVLPVCDVSGSMSGLPMDISIALGLYISERNKGAFKDLVCTFSAKPQLVHLTTCGLTNRIKEISRIDWGMNTNLEGVFERILEIGVKHQVPESDMPSMVLIISDMEFDACIHDNSNAITMIRNKYEAAGYNVPKVVFWNVNGRSGNIPVRMHDNGTALVSGFSPSILTSILGNQDDFTPMNIMLKTVMVDRYKF